MTTSAPRIMDSSNDRRSVHTSSVSIELYIYIYVYIFPPSVRTMNYESTEERLMRSYSLSNIFEPWTYANEPWTSIDLCQILIFRTLMDIPDARLAEMIDRYIFLFSFFLSYLNGNKLFIIIWKWWLFIFVIFLIF